MLLLGIDLGTSSIKVSVIDAGSLQCIATAQYPETEVDITTTHPGWAEQSPDQWWEHVKQAILKCHSLKKYDPSEISAIGIAYQMHGLVLIDKNQHVIRNSIIWCDSRAVETGNKAFTGLGEEKCFSQLLNSPGNFTASKLAWVKANEPAVYEKVDKFMLPGDYIAMKLTGELTTTVSALSEGIFWDFKQETISEDLLHYFGFERSLFPEIHPVFSIHGYLMDRIASRLSLKAGTPVAYKAGDQLNNALLLNVLQPGEVAATAGTSGVIYGISDELHYDPFSRINSFAHVNHQAFDKRIGILLCINGTGIFNRWIKNIAGSHHTYESLNEAAAKVPAGAAGIIALPFGNGAERMLNNKVIGGHLQGLDFNVHGLSHLVRAVQEGIAFSFRYGLDIMRENGINPIVIRAARTNLFLSQVFASSFANTNNVTIEFYDGDGSMGAAIGAGIGAGIYPDVVTAAAKRKPSGIIEPVQTALYDELYEQWKELLKEKLNKENKTGALSFSLS